MSRLNRKTLLKWGALLAAAAMWVGMMTAVAADSPEHKAAQDLAALGLIGPESAGGEEWDLNKPIARAEMVTIIVKALGKEPRATELKDSQVFSDTVGHPRNGYIAVAKELGISAGNPDGTFAPDAPVTKAQAVTFVLRGAGFGALDGGWPTGWLNQAVKQGLLPTNFDYNLQGEPATRGYVYSVIYQLIYVVKNEKTGQTLAETVWKK